MFDIADEMRIKLFEGYTDEQLAMLNELSWGIVNKLDGGRNHTDLPQLPSVDLQKFALKQADTYLPTYKSNNG